MVEEPRVFVLDDDPSVRERLAELLTSVRIRGEGFTAPTEFLKSYDSSVPGCLVLDVRLPEMSGLELHRRLVSQGALLPVIYLTAHADVALAVDAMKLGAVDFLEKTEADGVTELVRLRLDLQRHQECTGSTKANGNDAAGAKGRSGS